MYYVSFRKIHSARTGNILFQYLFALLFHFRHGHVYLPLEEWPANIIGCGGVESINNDDVYILNESELANISLSDPGLAHKHIIVSGFFQQDYHYLPFRSAILHYLTEYPKCADYWYKNDDNITLTGGKQYVRDFVGNSYGTEGEPEVELGESDIVISLRLDDFIHYGSPTSNILPPFYYHKHIESWFSTGTHAINGRLIIICDTIRHAWEKQYLDYFQKWSPIIVQSGSLLMDCYYMRNAPTLIHSNSTLCWIMSFLSPIICEEDGREYVKRRFIPETRFYSMQQLGKIELGDIWEIVSPLPIDKVLGLNWMCEHRDLFSLPYCIPDECIYGEGAEGAFDTLSKYYVMAPILPGTPNTQYMFSAGEEDKYYAMYRAALFAYTTKKGGWDCLRHYEILANQCVPLFPSDWLTTCPPDTMTTFPRTILGECYAKCIPWKNTEEQRNLYPQYISRLTTHMRNYCSTSATAERVLQQITSILGRRPKRILMLTGHPGVNYTRELTWIGIKRALSPGLAVEWPPIDYLYDSFTMEMDKEMGGEQGRLYGNGFTYSRRLPANLRIELGETEVIQTILEKQWDVIIYGKVGPDEMLEGSIPNLPLWNHVFKRYSRNELAFWYGGDECQDMTYPNKYSEHLVRHCQYAPCFVREFIRWRK